MDTLVFYQRCIKEVLSEYRTLDTDWSQIKLIFDDVRHNYMVVRVGWFKHKRIHRCLVHVEICDDQIIVQANDTEHLLDEALIDLGVPKQKIIPGFVPTEFLAYGAVETATLKIDATPLRDVA